jgi:enoyl-CoA hydratase
MTEPIIASDDGAVRVLTLARAAEYNTINPALRDALATALDEAERDHDVRAVLLRADGPAFCAGYQLDWATAAQAFEESQRSRVWDSAADVQMIGGYARTWAKLHEISKPTVAAVQGWCIAGGTNLVLHADLIVCFDGVARHTQEGLDFVQRSTEVGFRTAVRERDDPFGDYGSRPRR